MKRRYMLVCGLLSLMTSCNEQEFLKEDPVGFYSVENSYNTADHFVRAVTDLYGRYRFIIYGDSNNDARSFCFWTATDVAFAARKQTSQFGDYNVSLTPTSTMVGFHWNSWYKLISNANTIISRLPAANLTEEERAEFKAEAHFFRGLAYRYLVYLYGGVPLVLEEVSAPKSDFVRASKEATLLQIVDDLEFAAENLPSIGQVQDGKVSNLVAKHYLAEIYMSLDRHDEAIDVLSDVIDDSNVRLMQDRFGKKANEDPVDEFLTLGPGDVYWDLFRVGNQNRSSGNLEALWVAQMEIDQIGGLLTTAVRSYNVMEHWAGHAGWDAVTRDPDGKQGMTGKLKSTYNEGSGYGVGLMQNTDYYLQTVWQSDWDNDIRNAPHNIVRDIYYNNPSSAYYGMSALTHRSPTWDEITWRYYDWPSKISTPREHPDQVYTNKVLNELSNTGTGNTYRDMYYLRLPETYLLRAEAFFRKGDLVNAARDINAVRERAHANPVEPSVVTLNYILDERARELVYEEPRRLTLHRMGNLVERVRAYNPLNADEIQDYHGLWPIPYSAIEANTGSVIEQNPGYQ